MELQDVSLCLPLLLALSHCLSSPMQLLHVYHYFSFVLAVSLCVSQWHCVSACILLSHFLTVSHFWWLSLTVPFSSMELVHVFHHLPLFLAVSHCHSRPIKLIHVSYYLPYLRVFSHCLSSLIVFLYVSHCLSSLIVFVYVSHCLLSCCWLSLNVCPFP